MTARNDNQAEAVKLLPCPFCKAEMDGDRTYWTHPENDCILSEFEFDGWRKGDDDADDDSYGIQAAHEWNRRALAAPASGQGVVDQWKESVIEFCMVADCGFNESDPRKTINDLIVWHCQVALDPRVSSQAGSASSAEPVAPHILESLSWHEHCRDDLTLDEAVDYLRNGWKRVPGRTEHELILQIANLLAAAHQTNAAMPAQQADSGDKS